jgi:uncharacterized protein (TIGR03437 family)
MGKRLACIGRILTICLTFCVISGAFAQNARVTLAGHMRPAAIPANDQGRVEASLLLQHVTLMLPPSETKQADLDLLLGRLQDPASGDFHRWLTPEQYGIRFGAGTDDIARVTSWLRSQNLSVDSVGRGRTTIAFTGAARDVENTFQIEIHNYRVNGEAHYANASEPSVPAAFSGLVRSIRGLDDFRLKPIALKAARMPPSPSAGYTSTITGSNFLAPNDVATIFDITPVYNTGITGSGQKIAVVGQTDINLSDIEEFRSYFNLSANDPQTMLVPGGGDPGVSAVDLPEADLDLEWSGAIAPDATIVYVYSKNVNNALFYAIDQNVAPVITMSYGECEPLTGAAGLTSLRTYAQQAAAQGISWMAASGDDGANGCYSQASSRGPTGLAVDQPASIPEVTGLGGTTLNEAGSNYWSATNDGNHASALSYIPETAWNDTVAAGTAAASTGGASSFFTKPVWQTGSGVPNDGQRDVPDISMPASADHDAYLVYTSGLLEAFGGTSVSSPVFAGITGLLNQYLTANGFQAVAGQGNLNPRLYALANLSGVFHDVTSGDNLVPSCSSTERNCSPTQVGFAAGAGYDQTTGLGSVDAYNLIVAWPQIIGGGTFRATVQLTSSMNPLAANGSTVLTATVSTTGGHAPTGTVAFYLAGAALGTVPLTGSGMTVTAALPVTTAQLSVGAAEDPSGVGTADITPAVTAVYSGDQVYESGAATVTLVVVAPTAMAISGSTSAASFAQSYAPGMILALFGQNLATGTPNAPGSPLPTQLVGTTVTLNGLPVPLYYVSPSQINLQIPYEIPADSTAILKVSSNGKTATSRINLSATAPGIFADANGLLVPYQGTGRGQTIVLFETGDGLVTPQPVTGSVPAASGATPVPRATVSVSVGGVRAATPFAYLGVPAWSIGVTQVNFTIPLTAPLGFQPVVVTVGGVPSPPVYITVTP